MNEIDIIKSAPTLMASALGLLSACIVFVNGRLNEAKNSDQRRMVMVNTAIVADAVIFLGGCALVWSSVFAGVGLVVLFLSFLASAVLFVGAVIQDLRWAIVSFVGRAFGVIVAVFSSILISMVEVQKDAGSALSRFADDLRKIVEPMPNKLENHTSSSRESGFQAGQ